MRNLLILFCLLIHISSIYCQERGYLLPDIDSIEEEFKQLYPRRSEAYRLFGEMRLDLRYLKPIIYFYKLTPRRQFINSVYYNDQSHSISNNILTIRLNSSFESNHQMTIAYHRYFSDEENYRLIPIFVFNMPSTYNDEIILEIIQISDVLAVNIPFYGNSSNGLYIYRDEIELPLSDLAETTGFVFHINGESYPVELDLEARDLVLNYEFEEDIEEVRELEGSEGTIIIQ